MILISERLILRKWNINDAESLFLYAKDPEVGPITGWPIHKSIYESKNVIENVLIGEECYAICLKENNVAIGSIELILNGKTNKTNKDDECELGFWIGKPFWRQGYMSEAVKEILHHAFVTLKMNTVWCGYFEGNEKSQKLQEKCGFTYFKTVNNVKVTLLDEYRTSHINILTKDKWLSKKSL